MSTTKTRLPEDRSGTTLHFVITTKDGPVDGYLQTGTYPDTGKLGEIFLKVGRDERSAVMLEQWAVAASIALQHGVSVEDFFGKFKGTIFEPLGATNVPGIRACTSPLDLVARWLLSKYGEKTEEDAA